jgi:energy-converting hydrogenase Eha subunit G
MKWVGMAAPEQQHEGGLDHRGERRLSGKESALWYAVAAITYIGFGTWQKVLLTWFIGPMWLVCTLTFGPRLYDKVRGQFGARKAKG